VIVCASYTGLVFAMWGPFGPFNGMSYETGFALHSETSSLWQGFFFDDPLRIYTNFFYHLSYLLSKTLGLDGSWLGYQIVYAVLWLGRGMLCFGIVQRLAPGTPLFAYVVGALAIVHAADHTLNWVGQMNQFGFIFWMLLSFLLFIAAVDAVDCVRMVWLAALAAFFSHMSLWSYEAQLPMIALAAVLITLGRWRSWYRSLLALAIYVMPALIYIALNAVRYHAGNGGSYQLSVLRNDLTLTNLLADLAFNLKYALLFWHWAEFMPHEYALQHHLAIPLVGALFFVLGAVGVIWTAHSSSAVFPAAKYQVQLLAAALLLLLASFPAYLILNSARWLWRTQSLGGPAAALAMATLIGLSTLPAQQLMRGMQGRRYFQQAVLIAFGVTLTFYGVVASMRSAAFHFSVWERARTAMERVLTAAPRLAPNTILVVLDVARTDADGKRLDPWGDNMWFDIAVQLSYPRVHVQGFYFWHNGEAPPGNRFREQLDQLDASRLVVLQPVDGVLRVMPTIPQILQVPSSRVAGYDPTKLILSGPPTVEARNRYLSFKSPWTIAVH
jgi:hypothetical protein